MLLNIIIPKDKPDPQLTPPDKKLQELYEDKKEVDDGLKELQKEIK